MHRWFILMLTLVLWTTISRAQNQPASAISVCIEPDVEPATMAVVEPCQAYLTCAHVSAYNDPTCYIDTFIELVHICETESRDNCLDRATGYLVMFGALSTSTSYHDQKNANWIAWNLDGGNNYDWALELIDAITNDVIANYALELARGAVFKQIGDIEGAIEAYSYSIALNTLNPLPYYLRGLLYLEQGNTNRASQDFYVYSILAPENLLSRFPTPIAPFMMPANAEAWHLYGVFARSDSPIGTFFTDLTVNAPIDLTIVSLDEETIAVASLMNISDRVEDDVNFFQFINSDEAIYYPYDDTVRVYSYGQTYTGFYEPFYFGSNTTGSGYVLIERDGSYELQRDSEGFESGSRSRTVLLPADEPDPRVEIKRPCEDLPMSYLKIGDELKETGGFPWGNFYEQPESEQLEVGFDVFTWWQEADSPPIMVTDGPICGEENVWWQVTIDENEWWIPDTNQLLPDEVLDVFFNYPTPTLEDLIELSHRVERSNE